MPRGRRIQLENVVAGWKVSPLQTRIENATHYFIRRIRAKWEMIGGKRVKVSSGGTVGVNDLAKMICDAYRMKVPDGSPLHLNTVILILQQLPNAIVSSLKNGNVVNFPMLGKFEMIYTSDQVYYEMGEKREGVGGLVKKYYADYADIHFESRFSKAKCAEVGAGIASEMGELRVNIRAARERAREKHRIAQEKASGPAKEKRIKYLREHRESIAQERARLLCIVAPTKPPTAE